MRSSSIANNAGVLLCRYLPSEFLDGKQKIKFNYLNPALERVEAKKSKRQCSEAYNTRINSTFDLYRTTLRLCLIMV